MEKTAALAAQGTMQTSPIGKQGFTLLELVLAMTIGSILMTAVYGLLNTVVKARQSSEAAIEPLREARYVFDLLKKDAARFHPTGKRNDLVCDTGKCTFPIQIETGGKAIVTYELDNENRLTRQVVDKDPLLPENDVDPRIMLLSQRIQTAVFRAEFKPDKGNRGSGALVHLTLSFTDKPETGIFSYSVLVEQGLHQ